MRFFGVPMGCDARRDAATGISPGPGKAVFYSLPERSEILVSFAEATGCFDEDNATPSMKRALVITGSFVGLLVCMLMGIFSSAGVCAVVFGGEIVDTVLSAKPEPNRSHPAFVLFILLMVPGMLVGGIGGLFGIVFPLYQRFGISLGSRNNSTRKWLYSYAKRLVDFTEMKNGE